MNLLKHRQFLNSGPVLIHELLLIKTILEKTLKTIELYNIVVSEELSELLVFMPESAHAPEMTVFAVMESPALGLFKRFIYILLYHRMLVGTVFAEPTSPSLEPVVANLPPHGFSLGREKTLLRHRYILSHLIRWQLVLRQTRIEPSSIVEFVSSQLDWQEWLSLRNVWLVGSSLKFARCEAE